MRDLTLAFPNFSLKRKPKTTISVERLNFAILVLIILLGLVYLFAINSLSTKGYSIKKLQLEVDKLEAQQRNLQIQSSDLQSINRIQLQAIQQNFVPASNVTYIKAADYAIK